jgi:glutaminase
MTHTLLKWPTDDVLSAWADEAQENADYDSVAGMLPFYTRQEQRSWGVCLSQGPEQLVVGPWEGKFTLMSAVKPFLLQYLLEMRGHDFVFGLVGREPSALPFYSIEQLLADGGRPRNPMLNSGAMLLADQLPGETPEQMLTSFLHWLNPVAQTNYKLDTETYRHCMRTEDTENRRLTCELEKAGHTKSAERMFDIYFRLCCLHSDLGHLGRLGDMLALPNHSLSPTRQETTISIMSSCGLYEASGAWFHRTGIPAKSAVSGILMGIYPGKGSVSAFSPLLDASGNPVLSMKLVETFGKRFFS